MSVSHQFAYSTFRKMFAVADKTLMEFTLQNQVNALQKADKTFVTPCDEVLDQKLCEIAVDTGFAVISEEGEHSMEIVKSGNYLAIDPIDGTLAYLHYLNKAIENNNISSFLKEDLGL